jgi:ribosomal protein S18 acetylase RimI-like enzyme
VIFREATTEDIPALSEVRLSVRENVLSNPHLITREMYETHLCDIGKGWLCEVDGKVVGFSVASLRDASIWALFVKPTHEGRGIARELLQFATVWLFDRGLSSITLSTAEGTRAARFYESQGWKRGELKANGEVCYSLENHQRI